MTDNKEAENGPIENGKTENMGNMKPPVTVHAQYIKDLSVENPHAPLSLQSMSEPPAVDMAVNVSAREIEDKDGQKMFHEVVLSISVTAKQGDQVAMIAEIDYGLACTVHDMAKEQMHPFLLIEMPHMMFPFVRQIVADLSAHAGFNPFYLPPVNFRALYMQRFAKGEDGGATPPTEGDEQQAAG